MNNFQKENINVKGNRVNNARDIGYVRDRALSLCPEALEYLISVLRNDCEPTNYRMKAADMLLDRGLGLPAPSIKIADPDTGENTIMSAAQIQAILANSRLEREAVRKEIEVLKEKNSLLIENLDPYHEITKDDL